jgi:hypothetical protein
MDRRFKGLSAARNSQSEDALPHYVRSQKLWLPDMDSNRIIDRFRVLRNLLISQSRGIHQKPQKQASCTKSVQPKDVARTGLTH